MASQYTNETTFALQLHRLKAAFEEVEAFDTWLSGIFRRVRKVVKAMKVDVEVDEEHEDRYEPNLPYGPA